MVFEYLTFITGKFGIVYRAYYGSRENHVTVKWQSRQLNVCYSISSYTMEFDSFSSLSVDFSSCTAEDFIKERNIANKFDHPNILSLIGVCIVPEESVPLMVMPYMHHGDVKSFMKSKRADNIKVENFPSVNYVAIYYCI